MKGVTGSGVRLREARTASFQAQGKEARENLLKIAEPFWRVYTQGLQESLKDMDIDCVTKSQVSCIKGGFGFEKAKVSI